MSTLPYSTPISAKHSGAPPGGATREAREISVSSHNTSSATRPRPTPATLANLHLHIGHNRATWARAPWTRAISGNGLRTPVRLSHPALCLQSGCSEESNDYWTKPKKPRIRVSGTQFLSGVWSGRRGSNSRPFAWEAKISASKFNDVFT